ncbi:unnamed protein product [Spirodela intermedia]|uniref:Uncharacterized protein n=1 Tax=Spirodela intermedia TaxID=51605 RepID=A0A7I8K1X0_SPIIN|nr:unnamed protein product [Spirodela intermedia]
MRKRIKKILYELKQFIDLFDSSPSLPTPSGFQLTETISSSQTLQRLIVSSLRECSCIRDLKLVHAAVIKNDAHRDSFFANQFVTACSRLGWIDYALLVFAQVADPNAFVYNAVIRGLHLCSAPAEALELYAAMLREGRRPTSYTFTFVIKACEQVSPAAAGFAAAVHAQALKLGFGSNVFVQTALIDLYSKLGRIMDSKKVFDDMPERDAVFWTVMISAHAHMGDMASARQLFEDMPERSTVAWNTMIASYARSGDVESATLLFDRMPKKDLVSWTTMISCYAQNGQFKAAVETFKAMERAGVSPDGVTMATVISACAHLGALDLGREAHLCVLRRGFRLLDVYIGSSLVDMYAKCGSLESSLMVFFKLRRWNLFCWNSAIEGLAAHGRAAAALCLFRLLEEGRDTAPNGVTFVSVLSACAHAGLVEEGRRLFSSMTEGYSIPPAPEHYGCMVDLLGRAGRLDEALGVIQSMRVEPNAAVWGALLGACKTHANTEMGCAAASQLMALEPGGSGHYALSVNLYAQANEWAQVAAIRGLMKGRGVQKSSPGSSWIEIAGAVNEFTASAESHPFFDAIRLLLTRLDAHLKQPGCTSHADLDPHHE